MRDNNLIIGYGDVGRRVLKQLETRNSNVYITSRHITSKAQLNKQNVSMITADLDQKQTLTHLPTENVGIFYFAPPAISGTSDSRMENFIQSLTGKPPPKRIVYISTTGVYGDCQGQWITETAKLAPRNDRSKRRLHAESLLRRYCEDMQCEFVILRVSGIYSLEKLPLARLKSGMKVLKPEIAPSSNRIHADDLAHCCIKSMFECPPNEIFNIADGNPSSISDYFIQISTIFHLPQPTLLNWEKAEQELSPAMLSYLHESKKIRIEKLKKGLKIQLTHPTLKDGLNHCYRIQQTNR